MRSAAKLTGKTKAPARSARKRPAVNTPVASQKIDPLYVIFEQHLFNFDDSDSDRRTFIQGIVTDYLSYLRKNNVIVPNSLEQPLVEELGAQVNTMLVKKIYGCLTISDYRNGIPPTVKKRARTRYQKMSG